jgi:hypothetical protein
MTKRKSFLFGQSVDRDGPRADNIRRIPLRSSYQKALKVKGDRSTENVFFFCESTAQPQTGNRKSHVMQSLLVDARNGSFP